MTSVEQHQNTPPTGAANFGQTHWSVVVAARGGDSPDARAAMEKLCRNYWLPIYAFVRRQGHSPPDAQDLTQEFFARLLGKNFLWGVDRSKGKFRSFLLGALKHFLANEWDRAGAQKRGGAYTFIPIDAASAETSCWLEPADNSSADKVFERRWALALLDQVLRRLREDYVQHGKEDLFEQLKPVLTETSRAVRYADIAARIGASEGAVKVAVHRLRLRYRELLRAEIAETVASEAEIDDEIRSLFAALTG
jgi:RNA polymerase sigma-70 factor (ECF subfamily)